MSVDRSKTLGVNLAIFLTVVFTLIASSVAYSQVTGATVAGTLTDPSGGVVAGATVSTTNAATGGTRDVTSDASGFYTIPNLIPGIYDIRVSAIGFSTSVQSAVTLAVGQQLQLNFVLRIGNTNTTVQVTEAAPQIDLTSSALTGQVESETVRELPLNGRDWTSLAQLQPGVKSIETQLGYSTSGRGNRGFGGEMTISGQRSGSNNYRIDGISVNDYAMAAPGDVIGVVLGVDAVEEFQVLTGGFPAEYGRATGGVINAVSRSGTNQFHGAVYEFLRNSALDANDYFDRSAGNPIPPFKRNQFGASAGAPILKDRLFVFADYEGLRQNKGIPTASAVFSNNARVGDITYAPYITKYNLPSTGLGLAAGTPCTAASGNPGSYLSPLANLCVDNYSAALLQLFPSAPGMKAGNSDLTTFVFAGAQRVPEDFGTTRIDYKISNNDSLFGTFLKDDSAYTQPDSFNDVLTQSSTGRTTISLEESHTFGSTLVNAARIGFNRDNVVNQMTPTAINSVAGDPALGALAGQTAPSLTVHGGIAEFFGGTNANSHYLYRWNSYQYYDDAIWTKGAHTIKIGGGAERMDFNEQAFTEPGGRYNFSDYVGFLEGVPKSLGAGLQNVVNEPREFRQTTFSLYAQDDWKFKSNLTINLGLRYEPTTVLNDAQGRISNLATITAASPTCGTQFTAPVPAQAGSSCGSVGPYYKNPTLRNFEPRVGFAWDPFKNGKNSVRGSFGIYDVDPFAGYFLLQQTEASPFYIFKSVNGTSNWKGVPGAFGPGDGGTQLVNSVASNLAESTVEGNPHRSYVEEWSLTLQRQLTSDLSLTVGYVGSHGVHLLMRGDDGNMAGAPGSAAPYQVTPYGYLFPCGPPITATGCTPGVTPTGANAQVNPNMGAIRYIFWNTTSNYNGLNVNIDKKFSHGLQFQVAYTFSKSLDDDSQAIAGDTFANGINSPWWFLPRAFYGPSDFNVTHTLTINALYTIPTPKSWNGFAKQALAGWEVGGIFSYNSGTPTTPINNGDPLGLGNSGADQFGPLVKVAGCNPVNFVIGGPSPQYLNQNCYQEPSVPTSALASLSYPCGGFANPAVAAPAGQTYCANLAPFNIGRNSVTGPQFFNLDFSLHKTFPIPRISELFNVQFRAEVFDITNHTNFVPPQPCSGDCNSGLFNQDGSSAGVGTISQLANSETPAREIQFALKMQW
jgi:hypothetical protein